jgi:hypothetical protein
MEPIAHRLGEPPPGVVYTSDLRSVRWHGTLYEFTVAQAACVKVLMDALIRGVPSMSEGSILEAAGLDFNGRLRDIFRRGPGAHAWGRMIIRGRTRGTFRLAEQPDPPDPPDPLPA